MKAALNYFIKANLIKMFFSIAVLSLIALTNGQSISKPLIVAAGYPVHEHYVNTSDGYILKLFNIPASLKSPEAANKTVVFLQHGLVCSAADWIIQGPGKSIAYLLADAGKKRSLFQIAMTA